MDDNYCSASNTWHCACLKALERESPRIISQIQSDNKTGDPSCKWRKPIFKNCTFQSTRVFLIHMNIYIYNYIIYVYIYIHTCIHIRCISCFLHRNTLLKIHVLSVLPHSSSKCAQECERSVDLLRSQLPIVGGFFSTLAIGNGRGRTTLSHKKSQ